MDCKWPKPCFVDECLESCDRKVDTLCCCIATSSAEDQGSLSFGKFIAGCENIITHLLLGNYIGYLIAVHDNVEFNFGCIFVEVYPLSFCFEGFGLPV